MLLSQKMLFLKAELENKKGDTMGKYVSDTLDEASTQLTGHTNWEWVEVDDVLPTTRRPEIDSVVIFLKDPVPEEEDE